jgi:hypothetical protein
MRSHVSISSEVTEGPSAGPAQVLQNEVFVIDDSHTLGIVIPDRSQTWSSIHTLTCLSFSGTLKFLSNSGATSFFCPPHLPHGDPPGLRGDRSPCSYGLTCPTVTQAIVTVLEFSQRQGLSLSEWFGVKGKRAVLTVA